MVTDLHLVIHTQYYVPEIGAPQARLSELAERAVQRGHQVTVLTAMPNYPKGKIYPGYGGLISKEKINEVDVVRSFIYPTQSTGMVRRLVNYFSFVFSSASFGGLYLKNIDYLLTESPPLFLGLSGYFLSWVKGAKWIFNVSDLWPKSAVYLDVLSENSLAYRLSAWLERFCYYQAWLVSGQSKSILTDISRRFPHCRTFHFSNGVNTKKFGTDLGSDETRKRLGKKGEFVVLYAGLHGIAQGLDQIIEVASQLREHHKLRFVFVGDGPEKRDLMEMAEGEKLPNITFLDPCPKEDIPPLLACANAIIVPLKKYIPGAVPSKLYEAMASEKPVILIAEGEAVDIVNAANSGFVVAPEDIDGIKQAILKLNENPASCETLGANGRKAAQNDYDRIAIVDRYIDYLELHVH
jgi:colanic acid biosynthesis glycosyl transferase WcaI